MSHFDFFLSPVQHIISILIFFLTLIFSASLVQSRRSPGAALAWLLVIALMPYVGIPLYFLLGGRKIRRAASFKENLYSPRDKVTIPKELSTIEKILLSAGVPDRTTDNHISLISDGVVAYETILKIIDKAKESIYVETFILGKDQVGKSILKALSRKAEEGVEVYLMMDALGSFWANRKALREFRKAGGKLASFMPLLHIPFRGRSNLRDHRKVIVVDHRLAFVGGMNLADEYMGAQPDPTRWVDLALLIAGSSIPHIEDVFKSDWEFATNHVIPPSVYPSDETTQVETEVSAQIVASGPDVPQDSLYDAILSGIYDAKERVWIATPYFVPDESLARALELACRRGVDVRILIPARSNHLLADFSRGSYIRQIEAAGAQIYRYPKMLHAKANILDNSCVIVGSANMDLRSLFLNYEICVFIYSISTIDAVENWFNTAFRQSARGYTPLHFGIKTLEGIGRILSPML